MRHSCKSDSQTLAETLPSFLGWRKLCSLTFFLLSLSLRLLSPQALQYPGIKKRGLSLPPPRLFPEAKQQHGAVFVGAGVESYTEQHQIWPAPSYHCNYAFHCPDTKDDRMCGIGPMFHNVSTSFCINGLRERLVQQGNARLVPHLMDCIWGDTNRAFIQMLVKWRSLNETRHHTLVLTTVGGRKKTKKKHAKLYRIMLKMKIFWRLHMWYFYFFINVVARIRFSLLKNVTCWTLVVLLFILFFFVLPLFFFVFFKV